MPHSFKYHVRRAANRVLRPLGLHLSRADRSFEMEGVLARAAARGQQLKTIIDVGASDGPWSLLARHYFPRAQFVLFEPLLEHRAGLESLKRRYGFDYVAAAAGERRGETYFEVDPQLDGSAVTDNPQGRNVRTIPVEAIDQVVAERSLQGPYGLKLDTHGFELAVLAGAAKVLAATDLLIVEVYNFQLTQACLRFHEMCAWLEQRGFRCVDLADPMRRPLDGAFWQMDLAFVPANRALFESNGYR